MIFLLLAGKQILAGLIHFSACLGLMQIQGQSKVAIPGSSRSPSQGSVSGGGWRRARFGCCAPGASPSRSASP